MTLLKIAGLSGCLMLAALAGGTAALASEDYGPLQVKKTGIGPVLTDPNGMTVYTFDKDKKGKSNCYGECAEYWPPVVAEMGAKPTGDLTLVKRKDGKMQWADDGKPLYTYAQDKKPGDINGDGVKNVWHVVKEQ